MSTFPIFSGESKKRTSNLFITKYHPRSFALAVVIGSGSFCSTLTIVGSPSEAASAIPAEESCWGRNLFTVDFDAALLARSGRSPASDLRRTFRCIGPDPQAHQQGNLIAGVPAPKNPVVKLARLHSDVLPTSLPDVNGSAPLGALAIPDLAPTKVKGAFPRGLHPVIKHSMVEASRYLPADWRLEFMNALRDAPGVWNGPHGKRDQTGGALAVDVWLVNPQGERLCNLNCRQNFDVYRRFMEMVKFIQDRDFPAYRKQGRWGGYFASGSLNDEMHYDLEPSTWTMAGNWEKGLFPRYAHFGRKQDVSQGMGDLAAYRLPGAPMLASAPVQEPPQDVAAVALKQQVRPVGKAQPIRRAQTAQQVRYSRPAPVRYVRYEQEEARPVRYARPSRMQRVRYEQDD